MSDQADALRHEKARHVLQGREDRVEAIDAELAELGEPETTRVSSPENTAAPRPKRKA